jgi:two-component system chemotaxis sensor kinase CheA
MIEQLSDPLTHLLRNAIDHGLESPHERIAAGKPERGAVLLSASPQENQILIEVRDDGRGIDGPALKAKAVTKGMISTETAERMGEHETIELIFLSGWRSISFLGSRRS